MKYLLCLSYLGTRFCGFQVQPNGDTVQAALGRAAETLFARPCLITGCSRTDSGVHARTYYATVAGEGTSSIPAAQIPRALNTYLPEDISVRSAVSVPEDFSVRRAVSGKEYRYLIDTGAVRDPFLCGRACYYPQKPDVEKMKIAAAAFVGTHDFCSFMASGREMADTVRTVTECRIETEGDTLSVFVTADGFLYNMVRIMVGTLLEVSEGKIDPHAIPAVLAAKNRACAGRTAPAEGLYLNRVFLKDNVFQAP